MRGRAAAGAPVTARAAVDRASLQLGGLVNHRRCDPTLHEEHPLLDQAAGDSGACPVEDTGVSLPRHAHVLGCGILVQALHVGEPDGLELVESDGDRLGREGKPAQGTKAPSAQRAAHTAGARRPWHDNYEHMLITFDWQQALGKPPRVPSESHRTTRVCALPEVQPGRERHQGGHRDGVVAPLRDRAGRELDARSPRRPAAAPKAFTSLTKPSGRAVVV